MTPCSLRRLCTAVALAAATLAALPAAHAGTTAKTKYPLVLVHGFIGFDNVLGINYFYAIPGALRAEGAKVYIAQVNPSQTSEYRGEQLLQQMKQWAAKDRVSKFNLIGHSHGGPTVRYAAGTASSLVASVSTVAGTHFGSAVADKISAGTHEGSGFDQTATAGLKLINWLAGGDKTSQGDTSLTVALKALSTADSLRFNDSFPAGAPVTPEGSGPEAAKVNGNTIFFYSYSGTATKTNAWDVSDALLDATGQYFEGRPNDGLVEKNATHWGKVVKDNYHWNHLDEINQVLGTIGKGDPEPIAFYLQVASRLKGKNI